MPKYQGLRRWSVRRGIGRGLKRRGGVKGGGMYYGGKGGYWGRVIGGALAGKWGARLGDKLGNISGEMTRRLVPGGNLIMRGVNAAGHGAKHFFKSGGTHRGTGAYVANDALMMKSTSANPVVKFADGADGSSIEIVHNEYIADVFGAPPPGYFANQSFSINPGLVKTFPWLSQIAQNYQEYEFKQLAFTYKSTVSDFNSGTGQTGTVVICTQYNPTDEPFADKMTMLESDLCSSGKASDHIGHFVECDAHKNSGSPGKYTRTGPPLQGGSGGQDLKTYDWGTLNVAVCNIPAAFSNQSLGELHVSYRVVLRKVKQYVNKGWGQLRDSYYYALPTAGSLPGFLPSTSVALYDTGTVQTAAGQQNNINTQIIACGPVTAPGGAFPHVYASADTAAKTAWNISGYAQGNNNNFYIVFPAQATGNFKITIKVAYSQSGASGGTNWGYLWSTVQPFGSVVTIDDMLGLNGHWTFYEQQKMSTENQTDPPTKWDYNVTEVHIKISNPAGAAPSATGLPVNAGVCFSSNQNQAALGLGNCEIDIEQYNTIGNYGQNGLSDDPVVVGLDANYSAAQGALIPTWPPAGYVT